MRADFGSNSEEDTASNTPSDEPSNAASDQASCDTPKRVVFTDMDDTFLTHLDRVTFRKPGCLETTKQAYKALKDQNKLVIPCTGRSIAVSGLVDGFLDGFQYFPGIYLHGTCIYGKGGRADLMFEAEISHDTALRAIHFIRSHYADWDIAALIRCNVEEIIVDKNHEFTLSHFRVVENTEPQIKDLDSFLKENPQKRVNWVDIMFASPSDTRKFLPILQEAFGSELDDAEIFYHWSCSILIKAKGVNKGTSLRLFCDNQKISLDEVIAIGDGHNDIEMLQSVPCSIAMGQADDSVKSSARHVTSPIHDNGWAEAMQRFAGIDVK